MIDSKVLNSPIRWAGSKKKILNEMLNAFRLAYLVLYQSALRLVQQYISFLYKY